MRSMLFAALLFSTAALAAQTPQDARLGKIASAVDAARIKATVVKLVNFGTRHTLSSQTDPRRGIGASLKWSEAELRGLGLEIATPSQMMTGKRVPAKQVRICHPGSQAFGVLFLFQVAPPSTDSHTPASAAPGLEDPRSTSITCTTCG